MKQIFLVLLFSTMLFSAQKQIILGSYTQERNAVEGVQKLEGYIEDSDKLSWLKKNGAIEAKYKKIGKYFVVYLMPIGGKRELFRAYNGVKRYYNDAYAIEYSPDTGMSKIDMSSIEEPSNKTQASEEEMVVLEDNSQVAEVMAKEIQQVETKVEVVEDEDEYASDEYLQKIKNEIQIIDEEADESEESQEEIIAIEEEAQLVDEPEITKVKESVKVVETKKIKTKEMVKENNYFLEIILVILVIIGVGYIVYKNRRKNDEEKQEIQEIQLDEK